jgi:DNA-binding CsgD family transcriptional regulator
MTVMDPLMNGTVKNMVINGKECLVLLVEITDSVTVVQLLDAKVHYDNLDYVLLQLKCQTKSLLEISYLVAFFSRKNRVIISTERSFESFASFFMKIGLHGALVDQTTINTFNGFNQMPSNGKQSHYPDSDLLNSLKELSAVEIEVLFYLSIGYSNSKISAILCRSYHTVKNHKVNIARKVGLDGCGQLQNFVYRLRDVASGKTLFSD